MLNAILANWQQGIVVPLLVLALTLILGRILAARRQKPAGAALHIFAFAVALQLGLVVALAQTPGYEESTWWKALTTVTIISGALVLVQVVSFAVYDNYLPLKRRVKVPRLMHDLTTVVVLIIVIAAVMKVEFNLSLTTILTTSTILAAIIGLALQELLANLIAGIALQFEKPFQVGDWVNVDGKEGEVVEMSWRATRLFTLDGTMIVVPNGSIAKGQTINYYAPNRAHALTATVGVEYGNPPNRVKACLREAVLRCPLVLRAPAPQARLINYGDSSIVYEVRYWIEDRERHLEIQDVVMTAIWYGLRRERIGIPFPIRTVYMHAAKGTEERAQEHRENVAQILTRVPLFEHLTPEQLSALVDGAHLLHFGGGEVVVQSGATDESLYVIEKGTAEVEVMKNDQAFMLEVTLGPGDYFGEMALLTGEPRTATIRAREDLELVRIDKDDIAPILAANPQLIEEMSRVLAQRLLHTRGFLKEQVVSVAMEDEERTRAMKIMGAIRGFFALK